MMSKKLSILVYRTRSGTATHGHGRATGRCLTVYGESDRNARPSREHERVPGLTEPTGSDGRLQRGDGPGGGQRGPRGRAPRAGLSVPGL